MLQFEINKTIAESYNPRNERLYTIMYYGMVRTLPHSVEEMSKKKTIKKHKMSKFSCVHSVQILNAIIHSWSRTKVHAHCTIQWMRWLIFNWLLNIWTVDNVFPMCSLSLSLVFYFILVIFGFWFRFIFGKVFKYFPSFQCKSIDISIGRVKNVVIVGPQAVVCVYKIYSNSWKFPSIPHICFIFFGWQN